MKFSTSTLSNPGGRNENQDCTGFKIFPAGACWVLADGLGGHRGGEVASKIAVEQALSSFEAQPEMTPTTLASYLEAAQNAIVARQKEDHKLSGMRTTIVILLSDGRSALWAHVGDSRLYHFRNGKIIFQTRDHSVPQSLANAGDISPDEIRFHEDRNRLLRALGKDGDLRPKIHEQPVRLKPGDVFLLCTDGFWEYITEREMEQDLSASQDMDGWLQKMENRILNRAPENHDNYSAVAIESEKRGKETILLRPIRFAFAHFSKEKKEETYEL